MKKPAPAAPKMPPLTMPMPPKAAPKPPVKGGGGKGGKKGC